MSRRFGRNQKRAMRRQIEHLEDVLAYGQRQHRNLEEQFRSVRNERDHLRSQLNMCREALGPEFIGLNPVVAAGRAVSSFITNFNRHVDGDVQRMQILRHDVWGESQNPRHHIHFRARLDNGESAYCISAAALYQVPDTVIVAMIANELAKHLVQEVRAKRPGR